MFRNLRVVGLGGGAAVQHNLASLFYPRSIIKYVETLRHPPLRSIISDFEGVVLPGEMLRMYALFSDSILADTRKLTQLSSVVLVLDAAPF